MLTYQDFCQRQGLSFSLQLSVLSPDLSTLFTTSGMQKHKHLFSSSDSFGTLTDIQRCLRLNDLEEIGDGTHYLDFHMLGLFSFKDWTVPQSVRFWMSFLKEIHCLPDTVTIHPNKPDWRHFYDKYDVLVKEDPECLWSDGSIGGYCTEFYKEGVEIGNIVNPLGHSIDCGFGMERLECFISTLPLPSYKDILERTILLLLESGVIPSNTKQGYVLRKLIRIGLEHNIQVSHPFIEKEKQRIEQLQQKIEGLLKKYPNRPKEFYWETFGVDITEKFLKQ